MRKFTFQVAVFLLVTMCAALQGLAQMGTNKWQYSNPKPFGFWGWQIAYADDNTALLVGEYGGIARTTDGGGTWQYFAYTYSKGLGQLVRPNLNDVQFVNNNLVYAVGDEGTFIKSTDGGINWTNLSNPFSNITNYEFGKIHTVCFLDANTGYIGGDGDSATNRATIYKTIDGGATWQPEYLFPAPAESWLYASVLKIRFSASGVGYVTGPNGMVWKYDNANWYDYSITDSTVFPNVNQNDTTVIQWGPEPTDTFTQISTYYDNIRSLITQNYRAIAIINDTAVVVGTQNNGGLVRINTASADGSYWLINNGSSYDPKYYPLNSPQMYNAACRNGNDVAVTSSNGEILLSADKGFSFVAKSVYTPGTPEAGMGFYGIDIAPSGRIGLCGQAGVIADSTTSWRRPYSLVQPGGSLSMVQFIDGIFGIAAGTGGAMMRTNNGGNTWEDISNPTFNPWDSYTGICYLSPNVLIASASNAQLYKSFDRGTSLDLLYQQPENASIDAVDFINEDTGWILANVRYADNVSFVDTFHQFAYRSIDGGISWDTSSTVFPYDLGWSEKKQLRAIKFLNASIGFAVGDSGSIYKSTDGGINWVKQTPPPYASSKTLTSISIVDENNIFISGERNFWINEGAVVLKTTNGGSSWEMSNNGLEPTGTYAKILMYNASEGLVFGTGVVYATSNGGGTWVPHYTTMSNFSGEFRGASFAPVPGCVSGICQKAFAVAGRNIYKLDADVVLPVKFSELTGSRTPQGNQLLWTAFEQGNVSWFEIERSTDGANFSSITNKVHPGSGSYQNYQWLDATAAPGKNFYRIKAVERTGAVYYTNIVLINSKKAAVWAAQQSNGYLVLTNVQAQKGRVAVSLINAAGQVIGSRNFNHAGGAFNQAMPLPVSAKGIYNIKIDSQESSAVLRILIQ
jgi:photosystem II stability/assembly factor-like uncharacterized protein